jgi:urease alpha subunit
MATSTSIAIAVTGVVSTGNTLTLKIGNDTWVHTWATETIQAGLASFATAIISGGGNGNQSAPNPYVAQVLSGGVLQIFGWAPSLANLTVTATTTGGISAYVYPLPLGGQDPLGVAVVP